MSPSTYDLMAKNGLNLTVNPMFSSEKEALAGLNDARKLLLEKGVSMDAIDFPYMVMTLAKNVDVARENTEEALNWHFKVLLGLILVGQAGNSTINYENYNKIGENLTGITFDQLREKEIVKFGGPPGTTLVV
jgi:hypothetical protein